MKLSGWGRYPVAECRVTAPRTEAALRALVAEGRLAPRGNGRAYGDSAMSRSNTVDMRRFNRMRSFDASTGVLEAEAGVLLADVISAFLPRGWFPAVTPGTKFVTLGGMIAADVHGKNHHRQGGMGRTVDWLDLMGADGVVRRVSRGEMPELFGWTVGGMGLTGVILRTAIRLAPVETGWVRQELIPAVDLDSAIELFETRGEATYSVAWIDCRSHRSERGRALVMLGEHARIDELPRPRRKTPFDVPARRRLSLPIDLPTALLSGRVMRAFNAFYWRNGLRRAGESLVDWDSFFFPLDAILGWNRIYGRKGFVQFQCVLPAASACDGLEALIDAVGEAGQHAFPAVLKKLGPEENRFSFPAEGYTLALDFPVNRRSLALVDRLERIAIAHGGRFYLAKDARISARTLREADPRADAFRAMRREAGADAAFASCQSERLEL